MNRKINGNPRCDGHRDCFANMRGGCTCLSDNDFGEKDCPFYKSKEYLKKQEEEMKDG